MRNVECGMLKDQNRDPGAPGTRPIRSPGLGEGVDDFEGCRRSATGEVLGVQAGDARIEAGAHDHRIPKGPLLFGVESLGLPDDRAVRLACARSVPARRDWDAGAPAVDRSKAAEMSSTSFA